MNDQYSALYQSYQWFVPSQFNIAQACVHRWAQNPLEGRRIAIFHENTRSQREIWTYTLLSNTDNQFANDLVKKIGRASGRASVLKYLYISLVAFALKYLHENIPSKISTYDIY